MKVLHREIECCNQCDYKEMLSDIAEMVTGHRFLCRKVNKHMDCATLIPDFCPLPDKVERCRKCGSEAWVFRVDSKNYAVECAYHNPRLFCDNSVNAQTKSEAIKLWNKKQREGE